MKVTGRCGAHNTQFPVFLGVEVEGWERNYPELGRRKGVTPWPGTHAPKRRARARWGLLPEDCGGQRGGLNVATHKRKVRRARGPRQRRTRHPRAHPSHRPSRARATVGHPRWCGGCAGGTRACAGVRSRDAFVPSPISRIFDAQ